MGFNLKKYSAGRWLKGDDYAKGEQKVLTIAETIEHTFESGDVRPVLKFEEIDQWLSLNKTRNDKIIELFGDDSDNVVGKRIVTKADTVRFGGRVEKTVTIDAAPSEKKTERVLNPDEEFMKDL